MADGPPTDTGDTVEQFSYRLRKWLLQHATSRRGADQHRLLAQTDWDVLVVLDACRFDICAELFEWPVDRVTSPASCTPEWLERARENGLFDGATVLTANPQYDKYDVGADAVEKFWQSHWDERLQTVLPEPVLSAVSERLESGQTPVVAHLQQPHWPYVARIDDSWHLAYRDLGPWESPDGEITSVQASMARGIIDVERASRAYRASVHSVLRTLVPYLDEWLSAGRSVVVTADHGEAFGRFSELTMYEHPCRCHLPSLTSVPWITLEPTSEELQNDEASDAVEDRLRALGYAE